MSQSPLAVQEYPTVNATTNKTPPCKLETRIISYVIDNPFDDRISEEDWNPAGSGSAVQDCLEPEGYGWAV
jgi:hypothetical protein